MAKIMHEINEGTFAEIFEAYFEPICKFLNLYTKDKYVIEDILQEVFCNLWINRDFLQIKHLRSYLYTSARNRILNHIRNEKLHLELLASYVQEEKELEEAYECVDKEEFSKKIEKAIDGLPSKCQHIYKLSRYKRMTYKEIALQENISEKMVEKHISTALKKIREKLQSISFILL